MDRSTELIRALVASLRSTADQLEALLDPANAIELATQPEGSPAQDAWHRDFDPATDRPPLQPKPSGSDDEEAWCGVIFFGQLRAINVRERRGATVEEQLRIARNAGYKNRSGFSGWGWTWRDDEAGGRWVTDNEELSEEDRLRGRSSGMGFLRSYAKQLGVILPSDLLEG